MYHTHYTLSVAIELVHLLLIAARFAPAVGASPHTVLAIWLVYQVNSVAKKVLLYSLYWVFSKIITNHCNQFKSATLLSATHECTPKI